MKKSDLRAGMVVEKRNGTRHLLVKYPLQSDNAIEFVDMSDGCYSSKLTDYSDNLMRDSLFTSCFYRGEWDIVKVYKDHTCSKVLWERKEKPELTDDAETCLKILHAAGYSYIARDDGICSCGSQNNSVWVYKNKPGKNRWTGRWEPDHKTKGFYGAEKPINLTDKLKEYTGCFPFVKWEDEEPYSIAYLLDESDINE